jgi:aspartyl/asparaginyl-tRNA synthetase
MYEALSETDKGRFITDVIIPEAIIQIEILARDDTPISKPITPEIERLQYRAAIKRLEKRRKEKNPWEVRHFQALQAMGKFNKEVDENEELRRKAEEGKTHRFSWGGAERIVKVVDYRGT